MLCYVILQCYITWHISKYNYYYFLVFTDSGKIIILCMIKLQAIHMSKFKYFMVDMSYKKR